MKIKPKIKTYGPIFARADGDGTLLYGYDRAAIDDPVPTSKTPAETLLASIAACMVLSVNIVAKQKNVQMNPFDVAVTATKAADLPSRFGVYEVRISAGLHDDPELAQSIAKQAKSACTISNSVNGEIALILDP
ncbi:MAG: OsmC family protein [Rhodospirillales bacterium]|nr:OsmC family protein [Rhodospirillales bacterium]